MNHIKKMKEKGESGRKHRRRGKASERERERESASVCESDGG